MKRKLITLFTILLSVSLIATYSCKKEKDKSVAVTEVRLNTVSVTLVEGDTEELIATVMPENATDKGIEWKSDNESVATVSQAGLVTAIKDGKATITVMTNDGGFKATCDVTVNKKVIAVSDVQLNKEILELEEGDEEKLVVTVKPDDATDKSVVWESSNETVVTVDQEGLVKAVSEGDATITVKAKNGVSASCLVGVSKKNIPVTGVSLSAKYMELKAGVGGKLTETVRPENATNKDVKWESSDQAVAAVNNGYVTAKKEGTATITVTTSDGNFTASCEVLVKPNNIPVAGITVVPSSLLLPARYTYNLTAQVQPSNATDQNIIWGSNNENVAVVSETGRVTTKIAGTADIVARLSGKFATCTVQVDNVTISMTSPSYTIFTMTKRINVKSDIKANFAPDYSKFKFDSSDKDVATIDSDFYIVTHGKTGTTNVAVSYKYGDGELKTAFTITVM